MCHHLTEKYTVRFSKRHWCNVIKLIYWCYVSADFTLEKNTSIARLNKLRCISFNNTYSLMVQGNNVSFVVSEYKAYNCETIILFKNGPSDYPLLQ